MADHLAHRYKNKKGASMGKNKDVNLNSAARDVHQAKQADIKNRITNKNVDSGSAAAVKQQGFYSDRDKPAPDNNPFFTERSNPLSSKGN